MGEWLVKVLRNGHSRQGFYPARVPFDARWRAGAAKELRICDTDGSVGEIFFEVLSLQELEKILPVGPVSGQVEVVRR